MKEFTDGNLKFDENDRKFDKRVEDTEGKGEIARLNLKEHKFWLGKPLSRMAGDFKSGSLCKYLTTITKESKQEYLTHTIAKQFEQLYAKGVF